MSQKQDFTERQKTFLYHFIRLRNVHQAAVIAGYPDEKAYRYGMQILRHPKAAKFISNTLGTLTEMSGNIVRSQLDRIVTGRVNDAVALAFADEPLTAEQIARLDLDCISEIKHPKGGGCEIKFTDKLKAIESLHQISNSVNTNETAQSFLDAIRSAGNSEKEE